MLSLLLTSFLNTASAVPLQLTQQGRLVDSTGTAATGNHDLTFRIYNASNGGTLLWSETISTDFTNGYYSEILGSDTINNPLEDSVLESGDIYIELEVNSDGPLSPRQLVSATPYARIAGKAEVADSADWSGLTSVPAGLDDGDDDSFASLVCADGEQPVYSSTSGAWACGNPVADVDADSRLAALEALVAGLQTDLATANSTISTLQGDLTTAQTDITSNASGISTNSGDISTLNASVSTNTSDLATNAASISTNTTDIASNTTSIASVQTDVSDAQADISDLQTDLTTAESDIDTLQSDYTTLSGNVLTVVSADETWTIDAGGSGDYSSLEDAMAAARSVNIHPDATLTLQLQDGVYSHSTELNLNHPQGNNIHIQGNTADTSAVELYFNSATHGLVVSNGHAIHVNDLTVKGNGTNGNGLRLEDGAFVWGSNLVIEEFEYGIRLYGISYLELSGINRVQNNSMYGIDIGNNSSIRAPGSGVLTVDSNDSIGVFIRGNSYADLDELVATNNGNRGVHVYGFHADLSDSNISNNASHGLDVRYGGNVNAGNITADSNTSIGIVAMTGAHIYAPYASADSNGSTGVYAATGANIDGRYATLTSNGGYGSEVEMGSSADFSYSTVTNNSLDGLRVLLSSHLHAYQSTLSGNGGHEIEVQLESTSMAGGATLSGSFNAQRQSYIYAPGASSSGDSTGPASYIEK